MKLRFIFDLSGAVQEEFFTTENCCQLDSLEFHGEKVIFVPKLCVTPCSPWLILTYLAPLKKGLS